MRVFRKPLLLLLFSFLFLSCHDNSHTRYYLDDSVYWTKTDYISSIAEAQNLEYEKLEDFTGYNLKKLVGREGNYIWLKIEFDVPRNLMYKNLGLVIPYLHFADQTYINGQFIGSYGNFPPNEYSAMYASHFYTIPVKLLNLHETNTILIKVWAHGNSAISSGIYINSYDEAKNDSNLETFAHSRIYMLFVGCMFFAFVFFFMLSFGLEKGKWSMRLFALLNLLTTAFMFYFFAAEIPWYQSFKIKNIWFTKILLCFNFYMILYLITSFVTEYLEVKHPKPMRIIRTVVLLLCSIITLSAKDFNALMKICPYMLVLSLGHAANSLIIVIKCMITPEKRRQATIVLIGFLPLIVTTIMDVIIRNIFQTINHSYLASYGWFATIVLFLFDISRSYNKINKQNEHLSKFLQDEVALKTVDLTFANEKLERQMANAQRDMDMAKIVQKKFFPEMEKFLDGWEISVYFEPMNQISGDLYDYYTEGNTLCGMGLFDASGHGIASGLVTMLAKSIIFRAYIHSKHSGETVSTTLEAINDRLIQEKGNVQNYLTGVLTRFSPFDEEDKCLMELSSAGHPYPIMYCAKEKRAYQLTHDEYQDQYGALGIAMTEVSFPNVDVTVEVGDVFVFFSDGLSEALNENRDEFGVEKIQKILSQMYDYSAKEISDAILKELNNFVGDEPRSDDITYIVVKRVPRLLKDA